MLTISHSVNKNTEAIPVPLTNSTTSCTYLRPCGTFRAILTSAHADQHVLTVASDKDLASARTISLSPNDLQAISNLLASARILPSQAAINSNPENKGYKLLCPGQEIPFQPLTEPATKAALLDMFRMLAKLAEMNLLPPGLTISNFKPDQFNELQKKLLG